MFHAGTTPPHPSCGGTPQPQASAGGAIAGGVIGALLGVAGVTIVIVLVVYLVYHYRHKGSEKPSHQTNSE